MALWLPSTFVSWGTDDVESASAVLRSKQGAQQETKVLESFTRNQALPMNLTESADAFVLTVDAPGIDPSEVSVEVNDGTSQITVSTTFSHEKRSSKADQVHWVERASGFASRSVRLPRHANLSRAAATMNKGVLTISVPKMSVVKTPQPGRTVKVTDGGALPEPAGLQQPVSPKASDSAGQESASPGLQLPVPPMANKGQVSMPE
jgi:HSP20 family protein